MTDRPLTILFVVAHLATRSGLSLYVNDLATELHRRGHRPIVYSSRNGAVAAELRSLTIPVPDRLDAISVAPDLIHGNNYFETLLALLHFPSSPAAFTCHGWASAKNQPPSHPRIRRFIPVSQACRDRLLYEHAVAPESIELHYNFVDMARFLPRPPLPDRPSRAFVFNSKLEPEHLQLIIEECERRGVTLDVLGSERIHNVEVVLRDYDLVFACGRCALEAMAVGAALVVCGREGMGPMATTQNFDELRSLNFALRALRAPVTREDVVHVIEAYDAADAMAISRRVREEASLDDAVTKMLATYAAVIDEHRAAVYDRREEDLAIARFVSLLAKELPKITTKVRTRQTLKDPEMLNALVGDDAQKDVPKITTKVRTRQTLKDPEMLKALVGEDAQEDVPSRRDAREEVLSRRLGKLREKQIRLLSRIDRLREELTKTRHELAVVKPGVVRRLQSYLKKIPKL